MMKPKYPLYLGNQPVETGEWISVTDKFSFAEVSKVASANATQIDTAIQLAEKALPAFQRLASFERQEILDKCVEAFLKRRDEFAHILCIEGGKPIRDAKTEVTRLIDTFKIASQEATRIGGEVMPLDISARAKGYTGMWKRVPVGVCSFISPFNFPLNLAAHKIAPAIAVGCPFILKPASRTPISALLIGEVLAETAIPKGAFSILPCHRDGADLFATDERLKLLSFTGSPGVGWELKKKAGKKKVVLELGGNAACIIDETADIEDAVSRLLIGIYSGSGQSCISVQRIFVQSKVYEKLKDRLVTETKKLKFGDPKDEGTAVGPMISESEAKRLDEWIQSAVKKGATVLCGGKRKDTVIEPTLLENVPKSENICAEEAFGPVAILEKFETFEEALKKTNDSKFGLQAGIFTQDLYRAQKAWDELEVGGVIIGDVPSWRVDHMPYGGVKDSGLGREGIRWAIEDMTEVRMMVIRSKA